MKHDGTHDPGCEPCFVIRARARRLMGIAKSLDEAPTFRQVMDFIRADERGKEKRG